MTVQQGLNQVVETLLVIVVEQLVLDKIVNEPLVLDEQLVQSMIADEPVLGMITDERVLHKIVVLEEMCRIVEQLVKAVGDTVM
nr:hypothetical protein [Tanacetum cinerariifolium]